MITPAQRQPFENLNDGPSTLWDVWVAGLSQRTSAGATTWGLGGCHVSCSQRLWIWFQSWFQSNAWSWSNNLKRKPWQNLVPRLLQMLQTLLGRVHLCGRAVAPLYLPATLRTAPPDNVTGAYPTGRAHAQAKNIATQVLHNRTRQLRKLADQHQKFTAAEKKCATLQDQVKVMADEIAELREQLQIQKNISRVVHSPGVTWQYQNYC